MTVNELINILESLQARDAEILVETSPRRLGTVYGFPFNKRDIRYESGKVVINVS